MPNSKIISQYLSEGGAGTTVSIRPASAAAVTFSWAATLSGSQAEITRCIVSIEDAGNFDAEDYGALAAPLVNGITMGVYDSNGLKYLLTDPAAPIKTNFQWAAYCYDADVKNWGAGNNMLVVRWTFQKSGKPIYIRQSKGEYIMASFADTLSGLVDHKILLQGNWITPGPV